jgi:hypothetical protein
MPDSRPGKTTQASNVATFTGRNRNGSYNNQKEPIFKYRAMRREMTCHRCSVFLVSPKPSFFAKAALPLLKTGLLRAVALDRGSGCSRKTSFLSLFAAAGGEREKRNMGTPNTPAEGGRPLHSRFWVTCSPGSHTKNVCPCNKTFGEYSLWQKVCSINPRLSIDLRLRLWYSHDPRIAYHQAVSL